MKVHKIGKVIVSEEGIEVSDWEIDSDFGKLQLHALRWAIEELEKTELELALADVIHGRRER